MQCEAFYTRNFEITVILAFGLNLRLKMSKEIIKKVLNAEGPLFAAPDYGYFHTTTDQELPPQFSRIAGPYRPGGY